MPQKPQRGACTTYRRAKDEGYRARSAFKLMDIDDAYGLLRGANSVVDLCAAPGGWTQAAGRVTERAGSASSARVVREQFLGARRGTAPL